MVIVDAALKRRAYLGNPVRVGMIGAGFMARGIANQIINSVPGLRLVAIANRNVDAAARAYREAGAEFTTVSSLSRLQDSIRAGQYVVTDNATLLCEADGIVGPILKIKAEQNGVIFSGSDGDQPGVEMNLYRFVKSIGLTPLVCGNIKGLQDPYRNPTTQKGFAEKWGQKPEMVTSFADGSKISFEQTIVANATGFKVRSRGMSHGEEYKDAVMKIGKIYDVEEARKLGGIVDYVVGTPLTKFYVLAEHPDPKQQHYLSLYKMGDGPMYPFFHPYH